MARKHIKKQDSNSHYLAGGGELGELTRAFDWTNSSLGDPENWPQSLLSTVSTLLHANYPMILWWGDDLIQFYNDAYRENLGADGKHPKSLGQKAEECWPEIWHIIKPLIDQVIINGETAYSEDLLIPIFRNNRLEDAHWTFSYSKINDGFGKTAGVLAICSETTYRVTYNELKKAKSELEKGQAKLAKQRDSLSGIFMQAPTGICILEGPDMIITSINPSLQRMFPSHQMVNKSLKDAFPELQFSIVWEMIHNVYQTGNSHEGEGLLVPMARYENGPVVDRYFDLVYQPRYNKSGKIDGVIAFIFEVTEKMISRKAALQAEEMLLFSIEAANVGTWDINSVTFELKSSARLKELFGFRAEDEMTIDDAIAQIHEDYRDLVVEEITLALKNGDDYNIEYPIIGFHDKKTRYLKAKGKSTFDSETNERHFVGLMFDITDQKDMIELQRRHMEIAQNKQLFWNTLEAQEKERKRIAESLHNGLGQLLYGVKLNLEQLEANRNIDFTALKEIKQTTDRLLTEAIRETRRISHDLTPTILEDFGLKEAILDISEQFRQSLNIKCEFTGLSDRLSSDIEIAIYRTIQELITNVIKHAKADWAEIKIIADVNGVKLIVIDNGIGFNLYDQKSGIGLKTIQNKMKLLNGLFEISAENQSLTTITIYIPY